MGFDLITVIKEKKKDVHMWLVGSFWTPAANMSCLLKFLFEERSLFILLLEHTKPSMPY
jgi:hypothetical protein